MAEAITILGAIRSSQQVLWDFSQLIRRYRHLPGRVQDLEENLNCCQIALSVWKRQWDVADHHPDLYYEILWGKRGWREIQECLQSIKLLSTLVRRQIDRLVGSAFKYQGRSRHHQYDGRFSRHDTRRALDRIERSMSRRHRFFWSIVLRANDMDAEIDRFNTKLTNLERLAEGHLLDTHPTLFSTDPSQRHQERQGLIEDGMRDEMRKSVRYTREDAESIHSVWKMDDAIQCHLVLAQAKSQSRREKLMDEQLRFVLSNGGRSKEIQLTPARFKGSGVHTLPSSLNDISKSIYTSSDRNHNLLPRNATNGSGFKIYAAPRSALAKLDTQQPLSALLSQPQESSISPLKLEDQLAVAVGLIEGCYRHLGTPWLDYLDSGNVRGNRAHANAWMALLQTKPGNRSVNQALTHMSSIGPYQSLNLEKHKHIFRLGIVLTELALGALVSHAEASNDVEVPGVSLVFQDFADQDRLSAEEIAGAVENRTSSEIYAGLVKFCLSVLQDRKKIKMLKIDDAYEQELLEPTKELSKLLES